MCGSSGGREEQQGRGRRKEEGPSAPRGTAHPAPCRPRVTLARMSMVVQVSISCMDTGVCPSALPSRISTSCSAFSLNVSIKLTKELGKSTQISGQRDRPRAAAAPRPTLWGRPACGVAVVASPSLSGLPWRPSLHVGVVVIKLSPAVSPFPSTQGGHCPFLLVLMAPWVLHQPLGS